MVSWWVPYLPEGCRPDFNNGLGGDSNSEPVLGPSVYLSPTRIIAPSRATSIMCQMKYTSFQVSYLRFPGGYHIWPRAPRLTSIMAQEPDFNSDVCKQIRLCTGSGAPARTKRSCGVISVDMLTSLDQPTIRLRRLYGWNTSKERSLLRKKKKIKQKKFS